MEPAISVYRSITIVRSRERWLPAREKEEEDAKAGSATAERGAAAVAPGDGRDDELAQQKEEKGSDAEPRRDVGVVDAVYVLLLGVRHHLGLRKGNWGFRSLHRESDWDRIVGMSHRVPALLGGDGEGEGNNVEDEDERDDYLGVHGWGRGGDRWIGRGDGARNRATNGKGTGATFRVSKRVGVFV